jgi:UDP-GlcNAc:undecaprenyl-phosphate GlcNAc-1-phosphate transferase
LIDLMDGVAATAASVSAVACAIVAATGDDRFVAALGGALCGASLAFLAYNLTTPARAFLGDGGTMPIGYLVAALVSCSTADEVGVDALVAAPLLLGVPFFDMTYRVIHRLRRRISLLSPGRDSLVTHLDENWRSARSVSLALAAVQAMAVGFAIAGLQIGTPAIAAGFVAAGVLGLVLARAIRKGAWTAILADAKHRARVRANS